MAHLCLVATAGAAFVRRSGTSWSPLGTHNTRSFFGMSYTPVGLAEAIGVSDFTINKVSQLLG
jgi:hypothetical protein